MKQLLGSLLILVQFLHASYEWDVKIEKPSYFQEEMFLTTFICSFSDRSPHMYIEFKPKLKDFEFIRVDFHDQVRDGKRKAEYRFLAKALKPGKHQFAVPVLMRKTTDDSIKETVLGRDNDQDIDFIDTKVITKAINLNILPLPSEGLIVGSFNMEVSFSKERLKAYEPLQVKIKISGEGDFNSLEAFDFSKEGIKVFAPEAQKRYKVTAEGQKGYLIWQYALTSAKDINLLKQSIAYFDPKQQRLKSLDFKEKNFTVKPMRVEEVDSTVFPVMEKVFNWQGLFEKLFYFLLGFATLFVIQKAKHYYQKSDIVSERFETLSELLSYLITQGNQKELIELIENDIQTKKQRKISYYVAKLDI
jgi:hypothetical protein